MTQVKIARKKWYR